MSIGGKIPHPKLLRRAKVAQKRVMAIRRDILARRYSLRVYTTPSPIQPARHSRGPQNARDMNFRAGLLLRPAGDVQAEDSARDEGLLKVFWTHVI